MFKSVWVYGVASGWPESIEVVEAALQRMPFEPCGASQDKAVGWVPPRGQAHGPLAARVMTDLANRANGILETQIAEDHTRLEHPQHEIS